MTKKNAVCPMRGFGEARDCLPRLRCRGFGKARDRGGVGEPLKLSVRRGPYGPYAENLRHVFRRIEGYMVTGCDIRRAGRSGAMGMSGASDEGKRSACRSSGSSCRHLRPPNRDIGR